MKVTIYSALGKEYGGGARCLVKVYLNGKIEGWLSWGGKLKLKNVPEGEHTIEFISDSRKSTMKFTSSQNVKIWIGDGIKLSGPQIEFLVKGEDVKILENKEIEIDWKTGEEIGDRSKAMEPETMVKNFIDKYF